MTKEFKLDSGYHGEIRVGEPSYTKVTRNGVTKHIHVVDSETFSSIKKQIGISEKAVKDNSLVEVIKNYIPPGLRSEYRSGGKL